MNWFIYIIDMKFQKYKKIAALNFKNANMIKKIDLVKSNYIDVAEKKGN